MLDQQVFRQNDDYLDNLGSGVWLMDNHKWALYVWEKLRLRHGAYTLVHVDYHWDAIYEFDDASDEHAMVMKASVDGIARMIKEGKLVTYDSFIGPALARGLIDDVHFLCFQSGCDEGFSEQELRRFGCTQTIHEDSSELRNLQTGAHLLFDFCLDVFNRSDYEYGSDLWEDADISKLICDCKSLVQQATIVTVSMSYGCSGTAEDTRRLTERVVPLFLEWRNGIT